MKKIPGVRTVPFARVLACSLAVAAVVLGCGAEESGTPAAEPGATGAADLTYESLLALLGKPDGFERAREFGELLPKLGPGSLRAVKQVLKETAKAELELGAADYELLMRFWARHDPEGASSYAFGASPRGYRVGAIHATVRQWMTVDPLGAIEKIRPWTRQEGDFGAATQIALVRGWHDSGKPGLDEYIRDLGASFERQRAVSTYLIAMAHDRGSDAVVDWTEAQLKNPDRSFQLDAFRGAGDALIAVDVKAAQRFCDAHCDQAHGDTVRTRIAMRWVEVGDPRDTFAWLAKAPRNEETDFAVRRSYAIWADLDRRAALSWLEPLIADESAKWVRPAFDIYIQLYGRETPRQAVELVPRLFTGTERDYWMVEILRYWRQDDEAAAEAWMSSQASLSPETLAKVREPQTDYERMIKKQEGERRQLNADRARLDS